MQHRRTSAKNAAADRDAALKSLIKIAQCREKKLRHQLGSLISQQRKVEESEKLNRERVTALHEHRKRMLIAQGVLSAGDFLINNQKLSDLFRQECGLLAERQEISTRLMQLGNQQKILNEKIRHLITKKEKLRIALTDEYQKN